MDVAIRDVKEAANVVRAQFAERADPMLPGELSERQRATLQEVCRINTNEAGLFVALQTRGLAADQTSLARFCGADEPGALDAELGGLPLWKHLRGAMDEDRDFSILAALSSAEVLAACEDALTLYMTLHLPFPRETPDKFRTAAGYRRLSTACSKQLSAHVPLVEIEKRLSALLVEKKPPVWLSLALLHVVARGGGDPSRFTDLVLPCMNPGAEPLLREIFAALPKKTRDALILSKKPAFVYHRTGYVFHGCVPYLDLVGTTEAASILVDALTTRREPAIDVLVDQLVAIGEPALAPIDEALDADHDPKLIAALERARDTIAAAS